MSEGSTALTHERVAELERLCDEWVAQPLGEPIDREYAIHVAVELVDVLPALLAERERLREALARAGVPLEVLRGQIVVKPYAELTAELQAEIVEATEIARAALAPFTEGDTE